MSYSVKRKQETWNEYIIRLFRGQSNSNFISFMNTYFSSKERIESYQEGIAQEKENNKILEEQKKDSILFPKVKFAKKPDRLKKININIVNENLE